MDGVVDGESVTKVCRKYGNDCAPCKESRLQQLQQLTFHKRGSPGQLRRVQARMLVGGGLTVWKVVCVGEVTKDGPAGPQTMLGTPTCCSFIACLSVSDYTGPPRPSLLQNLNLMMGWPETTALQQLAMFP